MFESFGFVLPLAESVVRLQWYTRWIECVVWVWYEKGRKMKNHLQFQVNIRPVSREITFPPFRLIVC